MWCPREVSDELFEQLSKVNRQTHRAGALTKRAVEMTNDIADAPATTKTKMKKYTKMGKTKKRQIA